MPAKIRISKVVKYKGIVYPSNTDIIVDDTDVSDILKRGGWLIETENILSTVGKVVEPKAEVVESEVVVESVSEEPDADEEDDIDDLRMYAETLGIKFSEKWGIKRLKSEIAKVEKI